MGNILTFLEKGRVSRGLLTLALVGPPAAPLPVSLTACPIGASEGLRRRHSWLYLRVWIHARIPTEMLTLDIET